MYKSALCFVACFAVTGCAPALMKLPAATGAPAADVATALSEATKVCAGVNTISAEVAASGSVGGNGLRGRLVLGLARPGSARIEAVAPFGAPIFIFVARGEDATLLLPRDNRVLEHGKPEDVLAAVAGVPLNAADLLTALTGCAAVPGAPGGRAAGDNWRVVADGAGEVYLHRESRTGPWLVVASTHESSAAGKWRAEYRDYQSGLPRSVRLVSSDRSRFDLRLNLSQVEVNTALGADVFRVQAPADVAPLTLPELQRSGPLRGRDQPGAPKGPKE